MFGKQALQTMVSYHRQVNTQLLDVAMSLPDAALDEEVPGTGRSIRSAFWHIAETDFSWLHFLETRSAEEGDFDLGEDVTDLAVIGANLSGRGEQISAWLDAQTEEQLEDAIHTTWQGEAVQILPWQVVVHLMMHGMQHRTEIAAGLTIHGKSPGGVDLVRYL